MIAILHSLGMFVADLFKSRCLLEAEYFWIHGELLMLGFEVAQSTVSKYMVRGGTPPSQSWKTFLRNNFSVRTG